MTASRFEWLLLVAVQVGCRPGLASVAPEHDPANPDAPVASEEVAAPASLEDSAFLEPLPNDDGGHHHHHHHGDKR